jgi:hypothetical protein
MRCFHSAFRIPHSAFKTLIFRPFFKDSRRLPKEFPRICKGARKSAKDSPRILKDSKDFARHTACGVQRPSASFCSAPWATQLAESGNHETPSAASGRNEFNLHEKEGLTQRRKDAKNNLRGTQRSQRLVRSTNDTKFAF